MKAPVSAVIVACNEEHHIERCLSSVAWAAETIVVDAFSQDRTAELAEQMGARVIRREWPGYAAQKNFAIAQATQPWVLNLDADEQVTPALAAEIQMTLARSEVSEAAFRLRIPLYFLGRELGHYGRTPRHAGHIRLFRNGKARFDSAVVHERALVDGPVGVLQATVFHDSYPDPAIRSYWGKIHRYARLEAWERLRSGSRRGNRCFRAVGKLAWMLVLRRGLFHGPRAWIWIAGQAYQEWLTTAATARLRGRGQNTVLPSSIGARGPHAL